MSRKTVFLMGAPSGKLQWNEKDLLQTAVPPFASTDPTLNTSSRTEATKWRVLKSASEGIKSSHHTEWRTENTLFLDTTNLNSQVPRISDDVLLSQFYEHSLSLLGASYSSESDNNDTTLLLDDDSDLDESIRSVTGAEAVAFPYTRELHDVKDIPNAGYLRSIIPQTPSVTLVVAVIGINPLRRVTARQSKQELDILELIVGDETRTGFGITFWLPVPKETRKRSFPGNNSDFREIICGLRPRDIVLMRNVGLSSFQDLVYGQSLGRGMTKVDLLHRKVVDSTDVHGAYSTAAIDAASPENKLLRKVRTVRNWLMNFVGTKAHYDSHNNNNTGRPLPPDTQ